MKRTITKKERNQIIAILLGISAYSFLANPIIDFIGIFNLSNFWLIVIGLSFLFGVYKFFNII